MSNYKANTEQFRTPENPIVTAYSELNREMHKKAVKVIEEYSLNPEKYIIEQSTKVEKVDDDYVINIVWRFKLKEANNDG